MHTPVDVHYRRAEAIRTATLFLPVYAAHRERVVRKVSAPLGLPTATWINEPKEDA